MIIILDLVWGIYEGMYIQPLTWCLTLSECLHYLLSARQKLWTLCDIFSWFVAWCHEKNQKKTCPWTSLVVQWIIICLPMHGTQVQSLVREDSTCLGQLSPCATTTESALQSLRATAKEPLHCRQPQLLRPEHLEPVLCNKRSQHNEKPAPQ